MIRMLYVVAIIMLITSCNGRSSERKIEPPSANKNLLTYSVGAVYPHDTSSYTEGLLIYNGDLYESIGDPDYSGKSKLIKVDLLTGRSLKNISLDKKYFGEGIVILNDTIYQLTYREKTGFMYSVKTFKNLGNFTFTLSEGWGMTTNGKEIIASDGTSNLYYYQPGTFRLLRTQAVTDAGSLAFNINELEYVQGFIYANQWQTPYILKIDPTKGAVVAKADITEIWNRIKAKYPFADVPNGIAYNSATNKIYITGKRWPELYEIEFSK